MATVSKESYLRLMENRPYKFDEDEVDYREGEGDELCKTCIHFFTREADEFHTCEIFRPKDDESVDPEYVCDFWSDGEEPKSEPSSTRSEN